MDGIMCAGVPIYIDYTNWRGHRAWRSVTPMFVKFKTSEYHTGAQWFLEAIDNAKDEVLRDFALTSIHEIRSIP